MRYTIEPTSECHFAGIYAAFGVVASERRYLAFTEQLPWDASLSFYTSLIDRQCPYFVALEGERVLGWCDITPVLGQARMHIGVLGIALIPEARGQGIGTQLLASAIEAAWARGLTRIELTVRADNLRAKALYERHGFETEGLRRNGHFIDGQYHDVVSMALLRDDCPKP